MRVSWTARRLDQSIIREINPDFNSLEGLMRKLKLQYFGHMRDNLSIKIINYIIGYNRLNKIRNEFI